MIRRLRIKFVAIIMLLVTALLCTIFGLVYHFTQRDLQEKSIVMLQNIVHLPMPGRRDPPDRHDMHLPYFVLLRDRSGTIDVIGGDDYDLSDQSYLSSLLDAVDSSQMPFGVLKNYSLRYCRSGSPRGDLFAFADISSEQSTLRGLLRNCILIGSACLLIFLFISIALARWAVKPVDTVWRQQRQFVADASHELKTPLTVITTNAELLQGGGGTAQNVENILTMSRHMRQLVEQLLLLARADNTEYSPTEETVDLSHLAEQNGLLFEAVLFEHGLLLESDIEANIFVSGNRQELSQVLGVLLDNAQKYSIAPGTVRLSLGRCGHHSCRLCVSNPGKPLSAEEQTDIFKRFYRLDEARSRNGSFGLGLSIAQSLVQKHHGTIRAESGEGMNRFFVELPVKK